MPAAPKSQTFYRWVDAKGTVHVVSSLDAVPAAELARVEELSLERRAAPAEASEGSRPDWGSAALGLGAGMLLALVLPRHWKWVTRLAAALAVGALLGGGYLVMERHSAGGDGAAPREQDGGTSRQ